jgi:hypothetical protein
MSKLSAPLAVVLSALAFAPAALAHTTVKNQMTEGVRDDNALRIGHGCFDESGQAHAVIAQSVVFPTEAPVLTPSEPNEVVNDLSEVIEQGSLAGLIALIQDRSIFTKQAEKTDANGNVVGFHGTHGDLDPTLAGRVPFQFTPPNFVPESCVTKLLIKVAIADVCKRRLPNLRPERVNLWIPADASRIATEAGANGVEGIGSAATLTVNRNVLANPLPESCGAGFTLTVTPSAAQVDRDLPIPRHWPAR